MSLLDAALDAHDAGLCTLPAASDGSKKPALEWKRYQHERPTRDQVAAWFANDDVQGLGYVTGKSSGGLLMIEFESTAVSAGIYDQLIEMAQTAGLTFVARIDLGYCETSPSGGIHWLVRSSDEPVDGNLKLARRPGETANTVDVLIETRGEGGWTIAAPSHGQTHPSGKPWRLTAGGVSSIATVTRRRVGPLARSSEIVRPDASATRHKFERAALPYGGVERPGDVYNRTTTWAEILEPQGWQQVYQRDHPTVLKLGDLGGQVTYWRRPGKTEGISATTNALGTDRLKVFTSSTQFDTDTTYDKLGARALLHHHGDLAAAVKAVAPPPIERPLSALLRSVTSATALADQTRENGVTEPTWLPKPVDWSQFWRRDQPDREWLLEPFLVRGRSHALYAPAKTGKSLLVLESVLALATGQPFLRQEATEPVNVIYLDYEMTEGDLYQRLELMGHGETTDLSRLHYFFVTGMLGLDTAEGGRQVLELADRYQPGLIIIDTTVRAVDGDENDADTIRSLYKHTGIALKRAGITILRVDHAGKDLAKGQRGSSAKNDDVDVVWQLTGDGPRLALKCTHQRVGYIPDIVELQRSQEPLRHTVTTHEWPAGTAELADRLDCLDLPTDMGRRLVIDAVKEWNEGNKHDPINYSTTVLAAAIRFRKSGQRLRPVAELLDDESAA